MNVLCCSFGKDSIASLLVAYYEKIKIDLVIYVEVMFDNKKNISGENPIHRDFIYNTAIPKLKEFGFNVLVLHSTEDYVSLFNKKITRGENIGKCSGFPLSFGCKINRDLKTKVVNDYLKNINYDFKILGIACDEVERLKRLKSNELSLLEKFNVSEKMAYDICKSHNLLSPIYNFTKRNGCWFCPNQSVNEIRFNLITNHYIDYLLELSSNKDLPSYKFNRNYTLNELINKFNYYQFNIFDY